MTATSARSKTSPAPQGSSKTAWIVAGVLILVIALVAAIAILASGGSEDGAGDGGSTATDPADTGSASADACATDSLPLRTAGQLTVGTDSPAYEPWFVDNDPSNGKGFESAVAYAVAEQLGFSKDQVK